MTKLDEPKYTMVDIYFVYFGLSTSAPKLKNKVPTKRYDYTLPKIRGIFYKANYFSDNFGFINPTIYGFVVFVN